MQEQQQVRRLPVGVIATVSAVVLAAVGGGWLSWYLNKDTNQPPLQTTVKSLPPSPQPVQPSSAQKQVKVYWLKDTGKSIEVAPSKIAIKNTDKPSEVLKSAFERLLVGPSDPKVVSTIPKGTKMLSLEIRKDGVHVNLSKEFTTGGGSASMSGRVAQVLYTATSLNPDAQVWLEVEGKKLEVLGGEGLELDQPLSRKNFEADFDL